MNEINKYFDGEKFQCFTGIALAVISIGLAFYFLMLTKKTDFFKGIAYPFFIFSGLLFVVCTTVVIKTPKDIERVNGFVINQPEKIKTEEIPRMQKVMKSFRSIKIAEIILVLIGLGLIFFAKDNPFRRGIGFGITIQSIILYLFDHFAENRGEIYLNFLLNLKSIL